MHIKKLQKTKQLKKKLWSVIKNDTLASSPLSFPPSSVTSLYPMCINFLTKTLQDILENCYVRLTEKKLCKNMRCAIRFFWKFLLRHFLIYLYIYNTLTRNNRRKICVDQHNRQSHSVPTDRCNDRHTQLSYATGNTYNDNNYNTQRKLCAIEQKQQ